MKQQKVEDLSGKIKIALDKAIEKLIAEEKVLMGTSFTPIKKEISSKCLQKIYSICGL